MVYIIKIPDFDKTMVIKKNVILRKIPKYFRVNGYNVFNLLSNGSGKEEDVQYRQIHRKRGSKWGKV